MAALLERALEFALTKTGRDSQFLLKPEQKEIIEALGPVQTSNFTCAESNANERKQ